MQRHLSKHIPVMKKGTPGTESLESGAEVKTLQSQLVLLDLVEHQGMMGKETAQVISFEL